MQALMHTYNRIDIRFAHGKGMFLYDDQGQGYLDFASGIAVNALGHAHPELVKTLQQQAEKLWHVSNLYRIPDQETLARKLVDASFADRAFFCNSGLEAWEAGAKLARRYFHNKGQPHKYRMICFQGAFHGRSFASISSVKTEKLINGYAPLLPGFDQIPFGDMDAVKSALTNETGSICIEPVQGEGGIRPASIAFMQELRDFCDRHDLLLFVDEIQCGFGRTGKLFAYEWAEIKPDIMCIAKGMGAGFPVGALLATDSAASGFTPGSHGTTFGGNPLAMAVGNKVFDLVNQPAFLDHVTAIGRHLMQRMGDLVTDHPLVFKQVRGSGLMLGLQCQDDVKNLDVINALLAHHVLTVPAGDNVVRLLPPLIVEDTHIDQLYAHLNSVAQSMTVPAE